MADAEAEKLTGEWYQLGFSIARSMRYHAKRRAFFERCNQLTRALVAIASAGAIATFLAHSTDVALGLGILIALLTSIDLVVDFSRRAMDYDSHYRRFADLGIKWASEDATRANCRMLTVERLIIEKEEPTVLSVLGVICSNEELKARGFDYAYRVYFWQKWFCEVMDIGPTRFKVVTLETNPARA